MLIHQKRAAEAAKQIEDTFCQSFEGRARRVEMLELIVDRAISEAMHERLLANKQVYLSPGQIERGRNILLNITKDPYISTRVMDRYVKEIYAAITGDEVC